MRCHDCLLGPHVHFPFTAADLASVDGSLAVLLMGVLHGKGYVWQFPSRSLDCLTMECRKSASHQAAMQLRSILQWTS